MNENISRLMDGELGDDEFERCIGSLKSDDAMQTWVCYHVIGDQLRGAHGVKTTNSSFSKTSRARSLRSCATTSQKMQRSRCSKWRRVPACR